MKKYTFIFGVVVAFFATALFVSCTECDENDPASECYVPCDPTDPTSECYELPCDPTDPTSDCYEPPVPDPLTYDEGVVISGVKWATRNVDMPGTFAATPESAGMFYQWNRKVGWSSSDPIVNSNGGTVWSYTTPEGDEWEKSNDPCPAGWRVPNIEEVNTLTPIYGKVRYEWTTENGVIGGKFTDNFTEISQFLPAAGSRSCSDGTLREVGVKGNYWQGTYWGVGGNTAVGFGFYEDKYVDLSSSRTFGYSIRCVAE